MRGGSRRPQAGKGCCGCGGCGAITLLTLGLFVLTLFALALLAPGSSSSNGSATAAAALGQPTAAGEGGGLLKRGKWLRSKLQERMGWDDPPPLQGDGARDMRGGGGGEAQLNGEDAVWAGRSGGEPGELRRLQSAFAEARMEVTQLRLQLQDAEADAKEAREAQRAAVAALESAKREQQAAVAVVPTALKAAALVHAAGGCGGRSAPGLSPFSFSDASLGLLPHSVPGLLPASSGRALLESWRRRQLDWHDLVPPVTGDSDAAVGAAAKFGSLVQGELNSISYVQGFMTLRGSRAGAETRAGAAELSGATGASGGGTAGSGDGFIASPADAFDVSAFYAPSGDWGPFAKYAACPLLRDKCGVHASDRECVLDELCGWCAPRSLCVDRRARSRPEPVTGAPVPICGGAPLLVLRSSAEAQLPAPGGGAYRLPIARLSENGALGAPLAGPDEVAATCALVVTRSVPISVDITGNSKMAYHFFTESARGIASRMKAAGVTEDLSAHVWVTKGSTPEFLELLHAYTDACWRPMADIDAPPAAGGVAGEPAGSGGGALCYTQQRGWTGGGGGKLVDVPLALWSPATRSPVQPASLSPAQRTELAAYLLPAAGADAEPALRDALTSEPDAVALGHRLGLGGLMRVLRAAGQEDAAARVAELGGGDNMPRFLIATAGLWDVAPTRPHVTLLSRRNKRLILNERELVAELVKLPVAADGLDGGRGLEVEIASLESMPLYEQLRLFRRTTVLVGIHGSGLINSIFMHPGTALVQLMPYKVLSGASFFAGPATSAGVAYYEWTNPSAADSVFHLHFLGRDHAADLDSLIACGSACGQDVYFSFWINQDTWVDVNAFRALIEQALATSPVNMQLFKKS